MTALTDTPQKTTDLTESRYTPATKAISGPLLVATDGSPAGEAAFRAAATIAAKSSATVDVLIVVEPLPVLVPDPSVVLQPLVASPAVLDAFREGILGQLREIAPAGLNWHVHVEYGRPSAEITDEARERNARLIVIGLVHHGVVDRILDGETALEVVRHTHTPVLLASSKWTSPPKRALVAVDFSQQSMQAARAGIRLLGENATVTLAHVCPMPTVYDGMGMWEAEYEARAKSELEKFADALDLSPNIVVQKTVLRGHPASALLELGEKLRVDLIVAGSHGHGFVQRVLVGSVATRLMRHSTCSLLIVP